MILSELSFLELPLVGLFKLLYIQKLKQYKKGIHIEKSHSQQNPPPTKRHTTVFLGIFPLSLHVANELS